MYTVQSGNLQLFVSLWHSLARAFLDEQHHFFGFWTEISKFQKIDIQTLDNALIISAATEVVGYWLALGNTQAQRNLRKKKSCALIYEHGVF